MTFRVARVLSVFLVVALLAPLAGCRDREAGTLRLPPTQPLSGELGWIVVTDSYVSVLERPASAAAALGHLRDGLLLEVLAREYGPGSAGTAIWYRVAAEGLQGWVPTESVAFFPSKEQAQRSLVEKTP